mgnify:CR=1 FL=1
MTNIHGNKTLGHRLKTRRESLGLTLLDVATQTGLAKSHIWSIEEGRTGVTVDRLTPILACYGLPWAFLDTKCQHEYACIYCGDSISSESKNYTPNDDPLRGPGMVP